MAKSPVRQTHLCFNCVFASRTAKKKVFCLTLPGSILGKGEKWYNRWKLLAVESWYPHRKTNRNCSQVPPSPCLLWPNHDLCIAEYLIARSKLVVGSQGVDLGKSICPTCENSDLRHTGVMKKDVLLNTKVKRGQRNASECCYEWGHLV